ncbi:hypothetical protein Barb6_01438 [Bacteroidales bacterium Barb6]|nr:hypothetical protein Barb6_01438 [Bacteroidales bacterium Barb6]
MFHCKYCLYLYRSFRTLSVVSFLNPTFRNPTFRFAACGAEIFCPFRAFTLIE